MPEGVLSKIGLGVTGAGSTKMANWTFHVAQTERGWDVGGHDDKGNSLPHTSYQNGYEAAARLLQLMEINLPLQPQDWPERVEIG